VCLAASNAVGKLSNRINAISKNRKDSGLSGKLSNDRNITQVKADVKTPE
jgi:hypothetical protein